MRQLLLLLLAILVLLGGCETGESESESDLAESIVGTWTSEKGKYVTFRDDGTYDVGDEPANASTEFGTWSMEGDVLTKVTDPEASNCAGITATYEVELLDDGTHIEPTVVDDECGVGVSDFVLVTKYTDAAS